MRTQQERDEVTVVIATALLRFVVVLGCGFLALLLAKSVVGGGVHWDYAYWPLLVIAALVTLRHLYRHQRP